MGMEELIQALDEQWAAGKPDLAALLQQVPAGNAELALELCAADLEWRMRNLSRESTALPCAQDYADSLGFQWTELPCRRNLLEAEWCARSLWGDCPNVDRFAENLPEVQDWADELSRQLNGLVPLIIRLDGNSLRGMQPHFRANDRFTVGRQGTGDPAAPGWSSEQNRLIVANAHFRKISREQLQVRRTGTKEIELANLSSAVPIQSGSIDLLPGASDLIALPCRLQLGEVNLEFFTP